MADRNHARMPGRPKWMPLLEKFQGVIYGLSLETCMSNLKSVTLAVLELLAFSGQKFRGSRDHGHAHIRGFSKIFSSGC